MKITIHNVETNEIIERDMTAAELTQWEIDKAAAEAAIAAAEAEESKKQALLDKLGLTADEAKLLLNG